MADRAALVALVDDLLTRMSAADADGILGLYGDNPSVEDPAGTEPKVGREAIREFYGMVAGLQPKATRVSEVTVTGNQAAWQFTLELQIGDKPMKILATEWITVDDDLKITSMRAIPDMEANAG